jgi:DNA-binding NarL/FixJ family response regulator
MESTDRPVRVMIVEDQGLMRALFARWLGEQTRFAVCGTAASGEGGLAELKAARPDLALVDFQLPGMDGLEFVRAARQVRPQLRALIVSSLTDPLTLTRIRESGVEGYIEKNASLEQVAEALGTLADGRRYYSKKFQDTLAREQARAQRVGNILSRREQQVLGEVLGKKSNREIAELMGLSVRTVEFHRMNLMAKLDATNLTELLTNAQLRGWTGKA